MLKIKLVDGCEITAKSDMEAAALTEWLNECCHDGLQFIVCMKEDGNSEIIRISTIDTVTVF